MINQIASALSDLKGSPALLAVVLLQIATLATVYFISTANAKHANDRELALIEACREVRQ